MPKFGADETGTVGVGDEQVFTEVFFLIAQRFSAFGIKPKPLAREGFAVRIGVFTALDKAFPSIAGYHRIVQVGEARDLLTLHIPVLVAQAGSVNREQGLGAGDFCRHPQHAKHEESEDAVFHSLSP